MQTLAIVTPAYNEAPNLGALHARLVAALDHVGVDWHWIVVDDHSADETFAVVRDLAGRDRRVGGLRLSRNSGSHHAIACGLHHADADAVIVLASDLQDPPEVVAALLEAWRGGAQVVWAVRRLRAGEPPSALAFSRLYYFIMRRMVGLRELPATGSDFFLLDRRVVLAFRSFRERHTNVLALLAWMGFRQETVEYDKQPRRGGRSGWTLRKKLKLAVDSVTAFSGAPLAAAGWLGALSLVAGVAAWAAVALGANWPVVWSVPVMLTMGGVQLLTLGAAGAYLWRALDEVRGRPAWMIEDAVNLD